MKRYQMPLEPGKYYHIYNHANGDDLLFREPSNYEFFIDNYIKYLSGWMDMYSYCLLPNHFHMLIKSKSEVVLNSCNIIKSSNELITSQFRKFFQSYSQTFNRSYDRIGSLFMQNFKRKEVDTDDYFVTLILYIHLNPVNHGYVEDLNNWNFTSYFDIINNENHLVSSEKVINKFGGLSNFNLYHQRNIFKGLTDLLEK